jgi:hypothetical protein
MRIPTYDFGSKFSVVQEVMRLQTVKHFLEPVLEPLIRKVVKEEVELALGKHLAGIKW